MTSRQRSRWLLAALGTALVAAAFPAQAQQAEAEAAEARRAVEAERREIERVRAGAERERVEVEREMRVAEERLEEAARRIAELSARRLPNFSSEHFEFAFGGRPMLGITIDGETSGGPVEGVEIRGVSPGGAAFEAGLRAGDVITAINDESLAADNSATANDRLLGFMAGVEEGDTLDIEYLRDGNVATVDVTPAAGGARSFAFRAPRAPHAPAVPGAPSAPGFVFWRSDNGWGDLELVGLTEDLGRYFGTDKGLLVVRAPEDDDLKLRDGDVIHSIDGREPNSVAHAVRILGSYQAGETMEIEIMRDQRRQTLSILVPDNRQSGVSAVAPADVVVGVAPRVVIERRQ